MKVEQQEENISRLIKALGTTLLPLHYIRQQPPNSAICDSSFRPTFNANWNVKNFFKNMPKPVPERELMSIASSLDQSNVTFRMHSRDARESSPQAKKGYMKDNKVHCCS